jgi:hypothetical protein
MVRKQQICNYSLLVLRICFLLITLPVAACAITNTILETPVNFTITISNTLDDQDEVEFYEVTSLPTTLFNYINENYNIEYEEFAFGKFLTKIEFLNPDPLAQEFIAIYINDVSATTGIDSIIIQNEKNYAFILERWSNDV